MVLTMIHGAVGGRAIAASSSKDLGIVLVAFLILGLMSYASGLIARNSGRSFKLAFCLTFFSPWIYAIWFAVYRDGPFIQGHYRLVVVLGAIIPFVVLTTYAISSLLGGVRRQAKHDFNNRRSKKKRAPIPNYSPIDVGDGYADISPSNQGVNAPASGYPQQTPYYDYHAAPPTGAAPLPGGYPANAPQANYQPPPAPGSAGASGTVTCPKCGKTWTGDFVFCGDCGTPISRQ